MLTCCVSQRIVPLHEFTRTPRSLSPSLKLLQKDSLYPIFPPSVRVCSPRSWHQHYNILLLLARCSIASCEMSWMSNIRTERKDYRVHRGNRVVEVKLLSWNGSGDQLAAQFHGKSFVASSHGGTRWYEVVEVQFAPSRSTRSTTGNRCA